MSEYVPLGDDIKWICKEAGLNPEAFFEKKEVFSYGIEHEFLSEQRLAAFSRSAGLALPRAMGLCLKGIWEYHFACEVNKWVSGKTYGRRLDDILSGREDSLNRGGDRKHVMKVDTDVFFKMFEWVNGQWVTESGYTASTFAGLLKEMLLTRIYLAATGSPEMTLFVENQQGEIAILKTEETEKAEKFWLLKAQWIEKQEELGAVLIEVENRKIENENLKVKWMKKFGGEYITLEEMNHRLRKAKTLWGLKKVNPGMKKEDLQVIAGEQDKEAEQRIDTLRQRQHTPLHYFEDLPPGLGAVRVSLADDQEIEKKIIRDIWMLTHPDRLKHNPIYTRLTEHQRQYLEEAFIRANAIRSGEVGYHAYQVGWGRKSFGALFSIYSRIKIVLDNAGVEVDPKFVIRGESIMEKIEFLTHELAFLESGIGEAKATLIRIMDNAEVREWKRHLGCPEQHHVIKKKLEEMTDACREEAQRIENELAGIFEREERTCQAP